MKINGIRAMIVISIIISNRLHVLVLGDTIAKTLVKILLYKIRYLIDIHDFTASCPHAASISSPLLHLTHIPT